MICRIITRIRGNPSVPIFQIFERLQQFHYFMTVRITRMPPNQKISVYKDKFNMVNPTRNVTLTLNKYSTFFSDEK